MAQLSIGDAVGAGFELIRRRPWAVVTWGLVELAVVVATFVLFGAAYVDQFTHLLANGFPATGAATRSAGPSSEVFARMMQMQSASLLVSLASLFVRTIVYCAVFRAVLDPEQNRYGYLRLGAAELFLFILTIGGFIALLIVVFIPMMVLALLIGGLAAAHAGVAAAIVGVIGFIAFFVALAYVMLRFALVGPMIVDDGKFHLFDAWTLSKGHAGGLFVVGLCLFAILTVSAIVLGLIAVATGMGVLGSFAGGMSNIPAFFKGPPSAIMASLTPLLLIFAAVSVPLQGALHAIVAAPWARAYRDLSGPDLAATFA